jgi:phage terminase small subunit
MESVMTPKQTHFVDEYLIDLNATQAAIRAGYSVTTAASIGQENLTKPEIAHAIAEAQAARVTRTRITQDVVLQGLLREANFTGKGSSHGARVSAWKQLGVHLGMFTEKTEHSGSLTLEQLVLDSMKNRVSPP